MAQQPGKVIMIVNEFENSKEYRLQQIMHTLESVHGMKLDFESKTVEEIQALGESCEIVKNSIVKESAFNTAMQNPEYTKNMLVLEAVRIYLAELAPKRMNKKKSVKESMDPNKMVKVADFGRKMMDYAQNARSTDDKELRILNAISQVGDKLTQVGTPFGPKTLTDMDKKVIEVARRRMATQGVTENIPGQDLKLQPGMVKVKKDNGPEEVINTRDLENKQRQGYQPVAEDDELGMLYRKYGVVENDMDEAVDQDSDGDNDGADVMIARMVASGMSKEDAIAKTKNKPYNKESMMEMAKKDLHKLTKKKKELEDKMDKIIDTGGKVLRTDPLRKEYEKVVADIKKAKASKLKEAAHMETHDDYQASMARSELYRNTKYAMDMMKMIGPDDEVKPWIAANLTKAAEILDKVYHYMDYYTTFEQPQQQPLVAVDEEIDQVEGDAGSIARQNLMMIMEYSTKLFRMIKPGDKLEGWIAMKLTSASEAISCSKHHLDYIQFEKHAGDMMEPEGEIEELPVAEDKKLVKEASIANILMSVMLNEEQDLAQAETLLAAKAMSDELQGIAEKLAKMGVDDLMPLVDIMKEQFGQDAANAFNNVVKGALDASLQAVTSSKESADDAILAMQQGGVPGVEADISAAEIPGEEPESDEDLGDEFGATPAAAGEPEEPLGRAKKSGAPEELEESKQILESDKITHVVSKADLKKHKEWMDSEGFDVKTKALPANHPQSKTHVGIISKSPNEAGYHQDGWAKPLTESKKAKKPDFPDIDGDKDTKEPISKAAKDKAKAEKVDESKMKQDYIDAASEKLPGLKKAGWKKDMTPKSGKKAEQARKTADKRIAGMTKAALTMKEEKVNEVAPPGKKAEDFIKGSKADFKERYGKDWKAKLYATAWKKFGPKKESYVKATKMLEAATEKKKQLTKAFEAHKTTFARMVTEGKTIDPLRSGYGLEGQGILDQISETNSMISKLKAMIQAEISSGVEDLIVSEQKNELATKLSETKARTPFGVLWKDAAGKKNEKFFETDELRKYWFDLNKDSLNEHKLVNPRDFDKRIGSLTAKKG